MSDEIFVDKIQPILLEGSELNIRKDKRIFSLKPGLTVHNIHNDLLPAESFWYALSMVEAKTG